jgi:GntR family transcriptional repressor for pyruvate dehydrogenase complex
MILQINQLSEGGRVLLQPVARQTLAQQVLHSLRDYIAVHRLRPGDHLPAEGELATALGVSRNTLREALKALQTVGMVSRHPKRGTVLQPVNFALLAEVAQCQLLNSPADLAEVFVARRLLEVSILPLVAANATEQQFQEIEAAIRLMEAEIEQGRVGVEADIAFHRALVGAANNKLLAQFGAIVQEFFRDVRSRLLVDEANQRRVLRDHRQIVAALRRGEVAAAQRLMEAHLDYYVRQGVIRLAQASARKKRR